MDGSLPFLLGFNKQEGGCDCCCAQLESEAARPQGALPFPSGILLVHTQPPRRLEASTGQSPDKDGPEQGNHRNHQETTVYSELCYVPAGAPRPAHVPRVLENQFPGVFSPDLDTFPLLIQQTVSGTC